MLNRTSSHTCGRWNLPMFLFRDGLLTLINNASFIALLRVLVLPPHYTKIINGDIMTSGVSMVKYWGGCLLMFFEPLSKHPWGFSNVFLITAHPITFISIDDPTLLHDWVFIFRGHQEVLDSAASFKADLHSTSAAYFLQALAQSSVIRYHHVWFLVAVIMASLCGISFCWLSLWTWF